LFVDSFSPESSTTVKSLRTTPYNFNFVLNIYVRNTEDGTQIIEQILPYFNPDYNLTLDIVGLTDQKVDIPFILENINYNVEDVGGSEPIRVLVWTLTFTAKGYMYGPVISRNIIRKVTANTYNDTFNLQNTRLINLSNTAGSGTFKLGELVYQGTTLSEANSTAFVLSWDSTNYRLGVSDVNGVLKTGQYITGAVSNAAYNVASFSTNDLQIVNQEITPNPSSANVNTAFGFDETIEEFPNIT
jgi:hypothetical protein